MTWKNLPYWLKGGIISGVLSVILFFTAIFLSYLNYNYARIFFLLISPGIFIGIFSGMMKLCIPLMKLCPEPQLIFYVAPIIINFIIYFIIGAPIGWIYEIIKNIIKK